MKNALYHKREAIIKKCSNQSRISQTFFVLGRHDLCCLSIKLLWEQSKKRLILSFDPEELNMVTAQVG